MTAKILAGTLACFFFGYLCGAFPHGRPVQRFTRMADDTALDTKTGRRCDPSTAPFVQGLPAGATVERLDGDADLPYCSDLYKDFK
jgi:hypothetical protein